MTLIFQMWVTVTSYWINDVTVAHEITIHAIGTNLCQNVDNFGKWKLTKIWPMPFNKDKKQMSRRRPQLRAYCASYLKRRYKLSMELQWNICATLLDYMFYLSLRKMHIFYSRFSFFSFSWDVSCTISSFWWLLRRVSIQHRTSLWLFLWVILCYKI